MWLGKVAPSLVQLVSAVDSDGHAEGCRFAHRITKSTVIGVRRHARSQLTMLDCLDAQLQDEWIMEKCPGCSATATTARNTVQQCPEILVAELADFEREASASHVAPASTELAEETLSDGVVAGTPYALRCVVKSTPGHFICFIRSISGIWYKYDDISNSGRLKLVRSSSYRDTSSKFELAVFQKAHQG